MTPKLRFPGFTDEWQVKKLGDVSVLITSGSRDWAQYYARSGAKFIRMTNLSRDGINLNLSALKYVSLTTNNSEGSRTSLRPEDILISITAELGKIGIVPEDLGEAYTNQHTALARIDKSQAIPRFIAYKLATKASTNRLNRLNDSGAKAGLNLGTIHKFEIMLPSSKEQAHIADFLAAIDDRIAAQERKVELLRKYKKSVMQKIFTQQIRFNDQNGKAYHVWVERKLGDLLVKNRRRNTGLSINYVQSVSNKHGFVSQDDYFDGANIASKNTSNYFVIEKGMFAYNPSRINVGSLAYKFDNTLSIVSPLYISFMAKEMLSDAFLLSWFSCHEFNAQLHRSFEGSVRDTLSFESLSNMVITLPQREEQEKIADFLSAIDAKIKLKETKLAQAKKFRKSLLQRMFV